MAIMPDRSSEDNADQKDPMAVELGRRGGRKGGNARAASLTGSERSEIARKAAAARWAKPSGEPETSGEGKGRRLKERLRQAFVEGAEEHSRQSAGRELTDAERQRVLKRYPSH
jgi:hypothetical protein